MTPREAAIRWAETRHVPLARNRLSWTDARNEAPFHVDRTSFASELVRMGYARRAGAGTRGQLREWMIRSTPEERDEFARRAAAEGLSLSAWVVQRCKGGTR